jgi:hypothetical protein
MNHWRLFGVALLCVACQPARSLDWREPWRIPHDTAAATAAGDEFAWRLFVALVWPADPTSGEADVDGDLGANRSGVWERWRNSADVYRDDGADPGRWGAVADPRVASAHRFEALARAQFSHARHIVAGRMVPLTNNLVNAKRLIEIRMNRVAYEYIRTLGLYNLDGQIARVTAREPVEFPGGAIEVKASWRPIDAADAPRYHTLRVRLAGGRTRLYGLTALNVAAKELPQWFWASFEHVDNAARAGGEGWRLPSRDRFACVGTTADCNRAPNGIGLERGPWRNYRLRGTLTRYVDDSGTAQRLGNSELEAGFQESASCMTCHSRAALAVVDGAPRRLEVFASPSISSGLSPRRSRYGTQRRATESLAIDILALRKRRGFPARRSMS